MWNFCDHHPVATVFIVLCIGICLIDISASIAQAFVISRAAKTKGKKDA